MAVTITEIARTRPFKGKGQLWVEVAFDSAYPAGGEAIVAADLGVNRIANGAVLEVSNGSLVTHGRWDNANGKVLAYDVADDTGLLAEIANETDLATTEEKVKMLFWYD